MQILYSAEFKKQFRKLPKPIQELAIIKEEIFRQDQHHSMLRTHKLQGRMAGFLAFSINFRYRIIFRYSSVDEVRFYYIGGHEIYK